MLIICNKTIHACMQGRSIDLKCPGRDTKLMPFYIENVYRKSEIHFIAKLTQVYTNNNIHKFI